MRFDPSETALLDWLRPRIDDSCLAEISAADYGQVYADHLRALRRFRDLNELAVPLPWCPREVLELMRWSEPDVPAWKPGSVGRRGHLIRAFCCTALLKAADEPENRLYFHAENTTLIQFVASGLRLGREASDKARRFLSWLVLRLPDDHEEFPFFTFALVLLCAALFEPGREDEADLVQLAAWVVAEEARARQMSVPLLVSDDWLLGLTNFDMKHAAWKNVAKKVLVDEGRRLPVAAATALQEIAARLLGELF